MRDAAPLPARIGPAEFSLLGKLVAIRAPRELDAIFRRAGGAWEPGSRRWLIERRRIGHPRAAEGHGHALPEVGRLARLMYCRGIGLARQVEGTAYD